MSLSTVDSDASREREFVAVPRVLGDLVSSGPGTTLIVLAGLHGNEPAGVRAARAVFARCAAAGLVPRGRLLALCGNRAALERGVRFIECDLNRMWTADHEDCGAAEEVERSELNAHLERAIGEANGTVVVLDLHSTSAPGGPFTVFGDTLSNRRLALRLPVPAILGLEERVSGALLGHIAERGIVTVGFEGGQHEDRKTASCCEAAIWTIAVEAGVLEEAEVPWLAEQRAVLADAASGTPAVVEIRERHAVVAGDGFRMEPGFVNFQRVERNQLVAHDARGEIRVSAAGRILLPLYQGQGEDGFFLARDVKPVWLALSRFMRRCGFARMAPLLPGVRRHPRLPGRFLVDRRVARWKAIELLHLWGFRQYRDEGEMLVMGYRPEERVARR